MNIKRIRLELVRTGPTHNQLLSPLTSYIALCGDEPPETVHVPFEHYRFLRILQALRQTKQLDMRDSAFLELRAAACDMLLGIRSLGMAMSAAQGGGIDLIELELVLSASELSLIPFEFVFTPGGPAREIAPCEVVVTRRSRRVPRTRLEWPHRPRVLLASTQFESQTVPLEAHVLALREALSRLLVYVNPTWPDDLRGEHLDKYLHVLPNTSIEGLRQTIAAAHEAGRPFTHVHILAHGALIPDDTSAPDNEGKVERSIAWEPAYGLVLHACPRDPKPFEVVSGRRLLSALSGGVDPAGRTLPCVVTLATCDGGTQGGVIAPGASVVHEIHDGGVPLVVGSQFPLSFDGSVLMVHEFYRRILAGEDPRLAVTEMRRAVHATCARAAGHGDWGALVAYAALPDDIEGKANLARFRNLHQGVDAALSAIDPLVTPPGTVDLPVVRRQMAACLEEMTDLRSLMPEVSRFMARANLRWGTLLMTLAVPDDPEDARDDERQARCRRERAARGELWNRMLEAERRGGQSPKMAEPCPPVPAPAPAPGWQAINETWRKAIRRFRQGMQQHWHATRDPLALVDVLSADFLLGNDLDAELFVCARRSVWMLAGDLVSEQERRALDRAKIELWMLAPMVQPILPLGPPMDESTARDILDRQVIAIGAEEFELFGAWRHCQRLAAAVGIQLDVLKNKPDARPYPWDALIEVRNRARRVSTILEGQGVRTTFTAVVDWMRDREGRYRTIAT